VNPADNRASLTDLAAAYRPKPLQGPCGIILTTDLLADSELRWLELAPDAACELVAATADEILTSKTADFHRALGFLAGTSDSNPG
jgi:hypothetical protein